MDQHHDEQGGPQRTGSDAEGYQPISQDEEGNARVAGAEQDQAPNPETGVGIGMGQASSFEPEEDTTPHAAPASGATTPGPGDVAGE